MMQGSTLGEMEWAECESVIRRFEDAWRAGSQECPDVGDYYRADSPYSGQLLVELVHVDLEFRLRAGEFARAEDYLARFPELLAGDLAHDLIFAEFSLRNRYAPPVWPEEFWLRFPERTAQLRSLLSLGNGTGPLAATRPAESLGAPLAGPPDIAGYEIVGVLGRGAMGIVYKARDLFLHRTVAVKTFATVPRPDNCARFAREAEAIARLDHPHIVPVYEVGEWRTPDGGPAVPYFVMKWYPGGSMDATPAGPGTDAGSQAKAVETIARAVHHAHQRGILHRDLKPSNILLDANGRPHVADFGLAGRIDPDAPSLSDVIAGTPAYMAPEQAREPKKVSTAADVYGLGAILYHQLTGQPPFVAKTPMATLDLVANSSPQRPSAANPTVPRDLDAICLRCLEKDPARRYASAAELADDLERWRKGLPIVARQVAAWELAWKRVRRHPVASGLIWTTLMTFIVGVIVLVESNHRIREKEKETHEAYLRECAMRYKLEESLQREQRALYLERVSAAGRLYAANQLPEAWTLLDQCPEQFRGWEWRYLDALRRDQPTALTGHTATITAVVHLADGRMVSGDALGGIRVWDASGKCEREWKCGDTRVITLAAHPTKDWVAVADADAVTVWEVGTGRRLAKLNGAEWVAFAPDCPRLAVADGPTVRLWEPPAFIPGPNDSRPLPEWKQQGTLYGHRGRVRSGVFNPEGSLLFTTSADGTIRSWAASRGVEVSGRSVPTPVNGLGVASGGKLMVEAHVGCVVFTNPGTGEMRDRLDHPTSDQTPVAVSPDGRLVAVGGANGELVVWDVMDRRKRVYRGNPGRVSSLSFGRDGRLAACGGDQTLRVWDVNKEQAVRTLVWVADGVDELTVSPDGSQVAVGTRNRKGSKDDKTVVLDATSGRVLHSVARWTDIGSHPTYGQLVTSQRVPSAVAVAFSPNRQWVAVAERDGTVCLRDAGTGDVVKHFVGTSLKADVLCFISDGTRLVTGGPDRSVRVWDVESGRELLSLPGITDVVTGLAWEGRNDRLYALDHAVRVWDTK